MKYEVAIKGAYRKKRFVLGYVNMDTKPNVETALNALNWRYYDTRAFGRRTFIDDNDNLIMEDSISIKKVS